MKTKTMLELLTLSSSLYYIAKDAQLVDKMNKLSQKGKERVNKAMAEVSVDENGNELEFVDKIIVKIHELKDELNEKTEEQVAKFYKKIQVAHVDDIKAMSIKLEKLEATVALLEARLNKLQS